MSNNPLWRLESLMLSPYYKVYFEDVVALARSICVKDPLTPTAQNRYLKELGDEPGTDPRQWKYYLNLAGLYHHTDTPMSVVSSDTGVQISFDKFTLKNHPLTRKEYGPGGAYYRKLCDRYPTQVNLIKRILSPVDIDTTINAKDWTILDYDARLVGEGETHLINHLQKWINGHTLRWHITSFGVTHGLYPASMMAVMFQHMVPAIINIRAELSRTEQAADFHIWAYLGSRLRLDRFQEHLSHRQAMYLYQNIDYLQWHVGKERTMGDLLTNIANPTNLRATRYDIAQSDVNLIRRRTSDPLFLSSPYRAPDPETDVDNRWEIGHGLNITKDVALYNEEDLDYDIDQLDKKVSAMVIDTLPTGLVEMNVDVPSNEVVFDPINIRLQLWFQLADLRAYPNKFDISLNELGSLTLTPLDAMLLLIYAAYRSKGLDITSPPPIRIGRLPRTTAPTVAEGWRHMTNNLRARGYPEAVVERWVGLETVNDVDELTDLSHRISLSMYDNWLLSKRPGYALDTSVLEDFNQVIYPYTVLDYSYIDYASWVEQIELPVDRLTPENYQALATDLIEVVGGIELESDGVTSRHRAMIDIMKLLTSYGIIFVDGEALSPNRWIELAPTEPVDHSIEIVDNHVVPMGLQTSNPASAVAAMHVLSDAEPTLTRELTVDRHTNLTLGVELTRNNDRTNNHFIMVGGLMTGEATTIAE